MNVDCIWRTPLGHCGPAPSPDNMDLALCRPEGCPDCEPRTGRIVQEPPKKPVSGGSEEDRLP